MVLSELQKAVCLALWFRAGDWQWPKVVAPCINMTADEFVRMASQLVKDKVLESKRRKLRDPGRWGQWKVKRQFRLSEKGRQLVREMIAVIEQTQDRGKL